jgi:Fur family peroxide stress response transcriptional regulator
MKIMIERVKEKGIRLTPQRRVIIEILENNRDHPTADDIYALVTKKLPGVSLATVYNTLDMLVRIGEVRKLDLGEGRSRFDPNVAPHVHFICLSCNRVEDWGDIKLNFNLRSKENYRVINYDITFFGYCPLCKDQ